ncbi:YgaP family membrane protein [Albibacterium profundi]|uniref:DUF2892 domain-containing protein n=1 Tax=Albibacterium profundi TaxID=3134906 RepID=A0ABV5CJU0_9SPHI
MKSNMNKLMDSVVDVVLQSTENANVGTSERVVSAATGTFMISKGLTDTFSKPSNAVWELILGGALLYRGVTGYCSVKNRLTNLERKKREEPKAYLVEAM